MKPLFATQQFLRLSITIFLLYSTSLSYVQATDFITTWQTDNTGPSADDQITIPGIGTYTVNWEEVGNAANNGTTSGNGDVTVTFPSAGTYQVSIPSGMTRIFFNDGGDRLKLLTIEQWGTLAWTNMTGAFHGCTNLTSNAIDQPDLSLVKDMSEMFRECSNFNAAIGSWDVLGVTNMNGLFYLATNFDQPIGTWEVDSVTNTAYMFRSATKFNQDIGAWKVDSVTNMAYMFWNAVDFNQNIGSWNVGKVTDMSHMFSSAEDFDQDISGWTVSKVKDMSYMFNSALVFNQNIGTWDVSQVTNMKSMFTVARAFNQDIGNWEVDSVTNMSYMFNVASDFNQDISTWDVDSVRNMSYMFAAALDFNQDISTWDVDSVTNMSNMFFAAKFFNQDISSWNVSSVSNMSSMFNGAIRFNQDISSWTLAAGVDMTNMFKGATQFNQNLGSLDIAGSPTMTGMLNDAGLSVTNYDNTLIGWEAQAVSNLTLGASALDYCNADTERDELLLTYSWTIDGDTEDCSTLPVEWLHFDAVATGSSVQIDWATAHENNNDYFLIEKRLANGVFEALAKVAGAGASDTRLDYTFEDRSPMAAVVYYRLQQVDLDGRAERSNIVEVHFDGLDQAAYAIYPNPAQESFTLKTINEAEQEHHYQMLDLQGKTVWRGTLDAGAGQTHINVESLSAGTYLLQVNSTRGQLVNMKVRVK
ncbi:MAG: BspA family leucine-rich repeat surface protein [Bacteroidia bacterium]